MWIYNIGNLTPAVTAAVASSEYAWPANRVTIPALYIFGRSEKFPTYEKSSLATEG